MSNGHATEPTIRRCAMAQVLLWCGATHQSRRCSQLTAASVSSGGQGRAGDAPHEPPPLRLERAHLAHHRAAVGGELPRVHPEAAQLHAREDEGERQPWHVLSESHDPEAAQTLCVMAHADSTQHVMGWAHSPPMAPKRKAKHYELAFSALKDRPLSSAREASHTFSALK